MDALSTGGPMNALSRDEWMDALSSGGWMNALRRSGLTRFNKIAT